MTTIPGQKAQHCIISDDCRRARGDAEAFAEGDRSPGSYDSALFGISANLPQFLPAGPYNAVLTPVGQSRGGSDPTKAGIPSVNGFSLQVVRPESPYDCSKVYIDQRINRLWHYATPQVVVRGSVEEVSVIVGPAKDSE